MLKRFPTQNHEQIGPQIHFFLLYKYKTENCQLPPHVTEIINVFQGHIKCSTFAIAVNICLYNDYLHMQFELLLEPPDPAGTERKSRHYYKWQFSFSLLLLFLRPRKYLLMKRWVKLGKKTSKYLLWQICVSLQPRTICRLQFLLHREHSAYTLRRRSLNIVWGNNRHLL